ncbi:SCO4983 family protein, partial [Streptomyces sp. NPDC002596]
MYEPIRTKSVHSMADAAQYPHRTREEELDIQLAGHLAALLAVTDELGLGRQGDRIAEQVARLRGAPPGQTPGGRGDVRDLVDDDRDDGHHDDADEDGA